MAPLPPYATPIGADPSQMFLAQLFINQGSLGWSEGWWAYVTETDDPFGDLRPALAQLAAARVTFLHASAYVYTVRIQQAGQIPPTNLSWIGSRGADGCLGGVLVGAPEYSAIGWQATYSTADLAVKEERLFRGIAQADTSWIAGALYGPTAPPVLGFQRMANVLTSVSTGPGGGVIQWALRSNQFSPLFQTPQVVEEVTMGAGSTLSFTLKTPLLKYINGKSFPLQVNDDILVNGPRVKCLKKVSGIHRVTGVTTGTGVVIYQTASPLVCNPDGLPLYTGHARAEQYLFYPIQSYTIDKIRSQGVGRAWSRFSWAPQDVEQVTCHFCGLAAEVMRVPYKSWMQYPGVVESTPGVWFNVPDSFAAYPNPHAFGSRNYSDPFAWSDIGEQYDYDCCGHSNRPWYAGVPPAIYYPGPGCGTPDAFLGLPAPIFSTLPNGSAPCCTVEAEFGLLAGVIISGSPTGGYVWTADFQVGALIESNPTGGYSWVGSLGVGAQIAGSPHGGYVWQGSLLAGVILQGQPHGGLVWVGQFQAGAIEQGSIHPGLALPGSLLAGVVEAGAPHGGYVWAGSLLAGVIESGAPHGGYVWAGSLLAGVIESGASHGGYVWAGSLLAGVIESGVPEGGFGQVGSLKAGVIESGDPLPSPGQPTGVNATPSSGQVSIGWTAPVSTPAASTYNLYYGTSPTLVGATEISGLGGTSHTVTGLVNGTAYYFGVVSVSSAGVAGSYTGNIISSTPNPTGPSFTFADGGVPLTINRPTYTSGDGLLGAVAGFSVSTNGLMFSQTGTFSHLVSAAQQGTLCGGFVGRVSGVGEPSSYTLSINQQVASTNAGEILLDIPGPVNAVSLWGPFSSKQSASGTSMAFTAFTHSGSGTAVAMAAWASASVTCSAPAGWTLIKTLAFTSGFQMAMWEQSVTGSGTFTPGTFTFSSAVTYVGEVAFVGV